MRVVVASCYKYRDAWKPFLALFAKFFGGQITLLTDATDYRQWNESVKVAIETGTWCQMLAKYAKRADEPIILFQEDFFLNATVRHEIISRAIELVMAGAGCVRLYPCPGADVESSEAYFGAVDFNHQYRISCQTAVWRADYLAAVAEYADGGPWDFELIGSPFSRTLDGEVLAFKREIEPWPVEYICSAISRGRWNPDAKKLCDREGIDADWSMRPFAAA